MASTVSRWNAIGMASDAFQNFLVDRDAAAYEREMGYFAEMLVDGAPHCVGYDGVAALGLAETADRSACSGQVGRLP